MKKIIYWLTIIPALIDAIKGAISGIKQGLDDIETAKLKAKNAEQELLFEKANRSEPKL